MKKWLIYKHTCIENGKAYIGQTCLKNVNQRWRNGKGYKNKSYYSMFWNAIQSHGGLAAWDTAWTHEIIEDNILTIAEANEKEQYWIAYYHTWKYDPQCNGYNLTPGGNAREGSRLMTKDNITLKIKPQEIETYLANGWLLHDSKEYRPIKHKLWYAEHKLEQNAKTKKYHQEHKEEQNKINRDNCKCYYLDPTFRAKKKAYRLAHKEEERIRSKKSYEKRKLNPDYKKKHAEANKRWLAKKKLQSTKTKEPETSTISLF